MFLKNILNIFQKYFERDFCSGKSPKIDIKTQQQSPKPYGKDAQSKNNVTLVYKCIPNLHSPITKNVKCWKHLFMRTMSPHNAHNAGKSDMKFETSVKFKVVYRDVQIYCDFFDKTYVKHYLFHVRNHWKTWKTFKTWKSKSTNRVIENQWYKNVTYIVFDVWFEFNRLIN